jgi:hypothetical protein
VQLFPLIEGSLEDVQLVPESKARSKADEQDYNGETGTSIMGLKAGNRGNVDTQSAGINRHEVENERVS